MTTCFLFIVSPEIRAFSLEEFLNAVRSTHPAIHEAQLDAKAAKYQSRIDGWLPDPMVGLEFDEVPLKDPGLRQADMTNYKVSQEIPFPGKLISKGKAAKNEYRSKNAMATQAERETLFEAKKTYYSLYAIREKLKNQKALIAAYETLSKALDQRYDAGFAELQSMSSPLADVKMVGMKKAEMEADLFDLQHQEHSLISKINLMRGVDAMTSIDGLTTPKIKKISLSEMELETKFEKQNATLESLQWMIEKYKSDLSAAKLSLVPDMQTEFAYKQRSDLDNAYSVGMNLSIPLWLNRHSAEISQAKANVAKAKAEKEKQGLELKTELHYLAHHAIEHQKIVSKYRDEIVPLGKAAFQTAQEKFEAKLTNASPVMARKISYLEAQNMYLEALQDYLIEYAFLEMLVGEEL